MQSTNGYPHAVLSCLSSVNTVSVTCEKTTGNILIFNFAAGNSKVKCTVAHKGQCNEKWFAANKKDRMQTKKIMKTKKTGCKQKRSDANKKPKPVTMQALA